MTYARARLYLGISGVGTFVVLATAALVWQLPYRFFPSPSESFTTELLRIQSFLALAFLFMAPFDWLGGHILPDRYGKTDQSVSQFAIHWLRGIVIQYLIYSVIAAVILATGQFGQSILTLVVIFGLMVLLILFQSTIARQLVGRQSAPESARTAPALNLVSQWGLKTPRLRFLQSNDPGFTGGIVGLPGFETVILPTDWLNRLSDRQLAIVIARRAFALQSGSRSRGLLVALVWNLLGFFLATLLPGAGTNVASELITTFCGFTIWTFLGLLILPTASRKACFAIDQQVIAKGVSPVELSETLKILDGLQDDEPSRGAWIETIFHPVPSLENRQQAEQGSGFTTWHIARNTLFFSWPCLCLLSRVVHCNSGRPDLWALLPTD